MEKYNKDSVISTISLVVWAVILVCTVTFGALVFFNPPKVNHQKVQFTEPKVIIFEGDTITTNEFGEVININ